MSGDVVVVPNTQRAMSVSSCSSSSSSSTGMSPAAMTSPLSVPAYSPRPTPPVSTPTSAICALAPKVQQQPIIPGDVPQVTGIVTQKEWVIPPRPKPGRKPATDTPPTKRKAQNRAAQRAFRERRAARVNELEDKIKEIETEHSTQQLDLNQDIERLRVENAELIKENATWKAEIEKLRGEMKELSDRAKGYQQEIEQLKRDKELALLVSMEKIQQVASPPSESELGPDIVERRTPPPPPSLHSVDAVSLPPRRSLRNRARGSTASAKTSSSTLSTTSTAKATGGCMKDASGACPCMASSTTSKTSSPEPASYYSSEVVIHPLPKRPTSPGATHNSPPDKRTRLNATLPSSSTIDELETDFTAMYATGGFTSVSTPSSSTCMMADPCGFCSDGTPCVCAEMAILEEQRQREREKEMEDVEMVFGHDTKLPPLQLYEIDEGFPGSRMGVMHPPNGTKPAIIEAMMAAGVGAGSGGCGGNNGPGSCALCLKDPLAMLFCQSVASRRADAGSSSAAASTSASRGGCCGGGNCGGDKSGTGASGASNGGCCKDIKVEKAENRSSSCSASSSAASMETDKLPPMLPPSNSIYIPCSAAYQTLARHKAFEKASMDDFPGLVRPLVVSEETRGEGGGCPKVEVGSLRDVLKMLDRRFGKDVL